MRNKLLFFLVFGLWFSCTVPEDEISMALIQSKLDEEAANYERLRLFNCRQSLMNDVEKMVDSIMINNLNFNIGEGLYFPSRPLKPPYIGRIKLNDTLRALPFLHISDTTLPEAVNIDSIN